MSGVGKAATRYTIDLDGRMAKNEEALASLRRRRTLVEFNTTRLTMRIAKPKLEDALAILRRTLNLKETCSICLEETSVGQMYSVDQCMHRYCYSCMNQHVEVKLLDGLVPQCPTKGCNTRLNIHSCRNFLSPKLVDMMNQRLMEGSIPIGERFYCPYPRCSTLMSKKVMERSVNVSSSGSVRKCIKCHGKICINCKVPWHDNMNCDTFNKNLKETCSICLEETSVGQMFSVDQCMNRYCYSCMSQHVEVKLLDGLVPQCPTEGCNTRLNIHSCRNFLSQKLVDMMNQRLMEDSIPIGERFYCPYPRCSTLMSKKVLKLLSVNEWKCSKCHGDFCINCKVPWHNDMTCDTFKRKNPETGDAKVKSLATQKHWRQCRKCNHMIELLVGCFHMTCRCGYQFCYRCGAEWRNNKPCSC